MSRLDRVNKNFRYFFSVLLFPTLLIVSNELFYYSIHVDANLIL